MLHLVSLPHTRLDQEIPTCAYTAKVEKFQRMNVGRPVTVYGTEGADVVLLDEEERTAMFGSDDPERLPYWPDDEQWAMFNLRAIEEIQQRAEPGDLVLLIGGWSQRQIAEAITNLTVCEPFVGYPGIATDFCAFESHAWRHHVYGAKGIENGRWFDTVIPNYFDPDDFPHVNQGDGDYLLYVGRLIERKGVHVAAEIAKAAGLPLVVAGPGDRALAPDAEHIGTVNPAERAALMAGARAVLAPTVYIEPFGGVAVEAQICGTPAITSDWGAYTETVEPEWRFSTLAEAVAAVERAGGADHVAIRDRAHSRYSLATVAPQFDRWFSRLDSLSREGWYEMEAANTMVAA